jgi:hypothetical protein
MNAASIARAPAATPSALSAIVGGAFVGGALDLMFAMTFNGLRSGVPPMRVLQAIASGLLGMPSFSGGWPTALLGFFAHFGILLIAASLFYFARRHIRWMVESPWSAGWAFGAAIFAFMHLVVLPLSAAPAFKADLFASSIDFAFHVLAIGPAISLAARRFSP